MRYLRKALCVVEDAVQFRFDDLLVNIILKILRVVKVQHGHGVHNDHLTWASYDQTCTQNFDYGSYIYIMQSSFNTT